MFDQIQSPSAGATAPTDTEGKLAPEEELSSEDLALEIRVRIARWWPKGVARTEPEPPAVAFTKEAVAGSGQPTPAEAAQALATAYRYCLWRIDQGLDLDPLTAFNLDDVLAYLDGPLADSPKSTRKSARTYLRRLGRPGRAPDASRADATRTDAPRGAAARDLAPAIAELIETYVPEQIDPDRFERLEPLVRAAVRAFGPKTDKRAISALCWATYLAGWATETGHPLRTDSVFHPDTVEEYMAARLASSADPRTVATEGSLLRDLSKALCPKLRARTRTQIPRSVDDTPYSPSDVDQLIAQAGGLNTRTRRRYAGAMLAIGLALGPHGGEYPRIEPMHVVRFGEEVLVELRRSAGGPTRTVTALPEYAGLLEAAAARAVEAGDTYLLGGTRPTANRVSAVLADVASTPWTVELAPSRLRTTYLVGLLRQSHPVTELLTQAGVTSLGALDRVLPFALDPSPIPVATTGLETAVRQATPVGQAGRLPDDQLDHECDDDHGNDGDEHAHDDDKDDHHDDDKDADHHGDDDDHHHDGDKDADHHGDDHHDRQPPARRAANDPPSASRRRGQGPDPGTDLELAS
jgi:hypothetical protein